MNHRQRKHSLGESTMSRRAMLTVVFMSVSILSAYAQSYPGMVRVCTPEPHWIPASTPEYVAGHMLECTEASIPTPQPPVSQGVILQVGHYYRAAYSQVFRVTGVVSLTLPDGRIEDHHVLQFVTPNGGYCGRLGLHTVTIPLSGLLGEVSPQNIADGCPIAVTFGQ
jgi:hypothetical protein